ncbi:biopolymer transporter ExbD [Luteolibacter arcticus]|uniref:Biopolymer transporter ExbD n=1 Tax=Luteolibacter arcticus TaxID=1581411 RepID=A0ABT3GQT5_9BACT|nr:biopolymer transporter ExbD [Luteolibacter arcticus]MCW1925887.1 biopolymer transporter ExbD [Luteolibacter arcticus]
MASADDKTPDDINVTPMVDLYLVLLLIFIVMTAAGVQGMKVELPKASKSASKNLSVPKIQAITVDAEGKIQLNTTPVTLDELETKLTAMKATVTDIPVVVRGDTAARYREVTDVLNVLGRLGIDKIGLATQKPQ